MEFLIAHPTEKTRKKLKVQIVQKNKNKSNVIMLYGISLSKQTIHSAIINASEA